VITRRSALGLIVVLLAVVSVLYLDRTPVFDRPTSVARTIPTSAPSGPPSTARTVPPSPALMSVAPTPVRAIPSCAVQIPLSSWFDEHSTAVRPDYISVPSRVSPGALGQRVVYSGTAKDTGREKIELFKTTAWHSVGAGWSLTFQVWVLGRFNHTYGIMGIEAFDEKYVYLSEGDVSFTPTDDPAIVSVQYVTPPRTSHVAVYMQAPEQYPTSSFDLTLDGPVLYAVKASRGPSATDGRSVLDCPA
jgi:hypothetical protein